MPAARLLVAAALLAPLAAGLAAPAVPATAAVSQARFELDLKAGQSAAGARIVVRQAPDVSPKPGEGTLREIVLDNTRLSAVTGDGRLVVDGTRLRWQPPAGGGTLRYRVALNHRRTGGNAPGHDAWVGDNYALFRGEDAFPIRSWRRAKGSTLQGELAISLPRQWSLITPYLPDSAGRITIRNPGQRLPRPVGWITAGDLGTRRDTIAGIEITVTAPKGLRVERIAMLGLLRWTLPQLVPALTGGASTGTTSGTTSGTPLRYVSIVSAGEPLWLGALSAPNSVFVHADRPLISENGTSTIVHEMVHVLLADLETPRDQDWIDEGLAEYLALRALKDSGTIPVTRYDAAVADFRAWGKDVKSLRTAGSSGAVTARAVCLFHDLDRELRQATGGRESVASLVRGMLQQGRQASLASFRAAARAATGKASRTLAPGQVPGFD